MVRQNAKRDEGRSRRVRAMAAARGVASGRSSIRDAASGEIS